MTYVMHANHRRHSFLKSSPTIIVCGVSSSRADRVML